jgi:hypothetical protein
MAQFQGKRVSRTWRRVLRRASKDINFTLNSGRRTLREQWKLFRQNMYGVGRPRPGRPYTAFPSPIAPHIRVGRFDHALDVEPSDGGEQRLQNWLARHGVSSTNNVPGESWHLEATAWQLLRLARKIRKRQRRRKRRR